MNTNPSLHDLHILHRVATTLSFRKAALQLQQTPSAVSHAITRLEQQLQVRLFNRTTRSVRPTPAAEQLLQRLAPAFTEIDAALQQLQDSQGELRGRLRINLPRPAAHLLLAPRMAEWHARHPEIELELAINDALVDIVREGFDAGIRFGESLQQGMVATRVGTPVQFVVCASPSYLERHGTPHHPAELLQHACLQLRFPSGAYYQWEFQREQEKMQLACQGPLASDDLEVLLQGVLSGMGLCYHYQALVAPHVARGELVYVLQDWWPPAEHFYLYHPGRRLRPALLQALVDFLRSPR